MADKLRGVTVVLGTNHTGKTTMIREQIIEPALKSEVRVLVCVPDMIEYQDVADLERKEIRKFKGIRRLVITSETALDDLSFIIKNFKNGLLVFEDCRAFLQARIQQPLETLLIRRGQLNIEVVASGHGFDKVPPGFFSYMSGIILFKTHTSVKKRRDSINEPDRIEDIRKLVNQKAGSDINHPDFHYCKMVKI